MGSEDTLLDQSIEAPSLLAPKNTCQSEVTAGGEASLIIVEDKTLGKRKDDFSCCEHSAAKRNNIKVDTDEVCSGDVVDIQEEDVEMTQSVQPNNISDKVCEVLVSEENLDKSTWTEENKAPCDTSQRDTEVSQRRQEIMGIAAPSSSETNVLNDLIIMEDKTLGKRKDDFSCYEHSAANRNNIKVNTDEVNSGDVVDIQEDVDMIQSVQPNDVSDKVCEVLVAEENLDKSTCTEENKAPSDISGRDTEVSLRRQETMGIATPSSYETNVLNDLITQSSNEDMKLSLTRDPTCNSRRKLIVLDVNGLLADIVPILDVPDKYKPDTIISGKAVFKRPFYDEFLEFCFQRFSVGVWSSRTKRNVNSVVDFLMGELRHNLLFCWDQSHCTQTGYNTVENSNKPLVLKEIKRLWEKSEPDLPWERGEYNQSNTLLLDDSPYKALCNPPNTAIFPHTYQYRDESDNSLGPGGDLYLYLEGLAGAADVQVYVKQNPFGQQPITEEDASWDFYFKVKESSSIIPSHSSVKLQKDVLQTTNVSTDFEGDSVRGSLNKEDVKCTSVTLKVDELGGENIGDTASADSPSYIWRTHRRDRSESRNRSPVEGRSRSRSRSPRMWCEGRDSLSQYRRRSMSPSYRRQSEFSREKTRGDGTRSRECFAFIRGHCSRGVYCRYLHHEPDEFVRSRSYRCEQKYHDVQPTSKSADIYGKIENILPDKPVHERSKLKTEDMDQNSRVIEERGCMKEEVNKFQLYQRRDKVPCHYFRRGNCHWGDSCRYRHLESDKIDGSTSHWSKQQYQDVLPRANGSDMHGESETIPPERSVLEHSELEIQDLDQGILVMAETRGMKEECCKFTTQFSDKMRDKEPCRKFKLGNCHRGASCKYLHLESRWSELRTQDLAQGTLVRDETKGMKEEFGEFTNQFSGNMRREQEPCRKFKLGHCQRGASCKYLHLESRWSEFKTQNLDEGTLVREETEGKKDEFGKFATQFSDEPCRKFKFGNCHRGASCKYLHLESGMIGSSGHHWNKYPYAAPRSSGFSGNYRKTETPQRLVQEQNECKTWDLEQGVSDMVRNGINDHLGESSSQLWDITRREKEPCRKFMRGACHFGAHCKYLHTEFDKPLIPECRDFRNGKCDRLYCRYQHREYEETDRSIAYNSKQQYQNSPSISKMPVCWETENISRERLVFQHNELKTHDIKNHIAGMEEGKDMKEELGRSISQPCDEQNHLGSEPPVLLHADVEDEKVPDDVANCVPTPV